MEPIDLVLLAACGVLLMVASARLKMRYRLRSAVRLVRRKEIL